jgi:hypoxanthine phosphoribosyltransferase
MSSASEIVFHHITYERFLADIEVLARALEADAWKPDYIVGIGRGGLVPGCFLSHRTGIALLSVDHSSKVYDFAEALLARLAEHSARGERYLFVDDINDTGKTIAHMRAAIRDGGGNPDNVRIAVLVDNAVSAANVDYSAWQIDRTVDKDWFVFPWESVAPAEVLDGEAREDPDRLSLGSEA